MTEIGPFYLVNEETDKVFSSNYDNNANGYVLKNESNYNKHYPEEFYLQHIKDDGYKFYIKKNNIILYLTQSTYLNKPVFTESSKDTIKLHKVGENQFNIQLIGLLETTPRDIYRYQEYLVRRNDNNKNIYSIKNGMDTRYNQNRTNHTKVNLVFKIKPTDFTYTNSQDILNLDPITEFTNSTLPAPTSTTVSTPAPTSTTVSTPAPTSNTVSTPAPTSNTVSTPAPPTTQAPKSKDSNKTLPIVIGVLVSVAVIGGIIFYLKKKGYILNKKINLGN